MKMHQKAYFCFKSYKNIFVPILEVVSLQKTVLQAFLYKFIVFILFSCVIAQL